MLKKMLVFFVAALSVFAAVPLFIVARDSGLTGFHFAAALIVAFCLTFSGSMSAVMCFAPDTRVWPIRLVLRLLVAGLYFAASGAAVAHLTHGYWASSTSSSGWSAKN